MTQHDFIIRRKIEELDPPFYAIIMAAFRKADSTNAKLLQDAFPEIWAEFYDRYWNGDRDGWLPSDLRPQIPVIDPTFTKETP
jgi:hypothetical protein